MILSVRVKNLIITYQIWLSKKDFEKLEQLPRKEKFYSSLTGKEINDREYEHALKVLGKFEMKMMKD